jgi:hypothetical protein
MLSMNFSLSYVRLYCVDLSWSCICWTICVVLYNCTKLCVPMFYPLIYVACVCSIFIMPKIFLIFRWFFSEFFCNINQQNWLCEFINKTDQFINKPTDLSIEFKQMSDLNFVPIFDRFSRFSHISQYGTGSVLLTISISQSLSGGRRSKYRGSPIRWGEGSQRNSSWGRSYIWYAHDVWEMSLQLAWPNLHVERTKNVITIIAWPDWEVTHHVILHPQ